MYEITNDKQRIIIGTLPDRKNPVLMISVPPTHLHVLATFRDDKAAKEFVDYLGKMMKTGWIE